MTSLTQFQRVFFGYPLCSDVKQGQNDEAEAKTLETEVEAKTTRSKLRPSLRDPGWPQVDISE